MLFNLSGWEKPERLGFLLFNLSGWKKPERLK